MWLATWSRGSLACWLEGKPQALTGEMEDSKMVLASTSVLVVEQASQMAAISIRVPRESPSCLLPLQEALQDQQLGLTVPLCWDSEQVRFCVCPLRAESLFLTALHLSCRQAPLAFKARHSGDSSSGCRTPRLRSPVWGSAPSLLGDNLCSCNYTPVYVSPTRVWAS